MSRVFAIGDEKNRTVTITGLTADEKKSVPSWLCELPADTRAGRVTKIVPNENGDIVVEFSRISTAGMMTELVRHCLVQNGINRSKGLAMTHFTRDH